jgi:uncharacterized membrane protein
MTYSMRVLGLPAAWAIAAWLLCCLNLDCFAQELKESEVVSFEMDVAPLLDRRCATCHAGEHAKAGFRIDDRETVLGYIEPGDPENSVLWSDYINGESAVHNPETSVMPMSGPIPMDELNVVERWIEQGADWPAGVRFVSIGGTFVADAVNTRPNSLLSRIIGFFGYFHPAVVHFPIALLMFGGGAAALSFFTGNRATFVAFYCLLWGSLSATVSSVFGWCYADEKGYPAWSVVPTEKSIEAAAAIFRHRWLGTATAIVSIVVMAVAIRALRKPKSSLQQVWRIGLIVVAVMVAIVGHQGGELVYGDLVQRAFDRLAGN